MINKIYNYFLRELQKEASRKLLMAIVYALDKRDRYTNAHSERVAKLATELAMELNLSEKEVYAIGIAARIHDLGKLGIPDQILCKPGALTEEEYCKMQEHPVIGWEIVNVLSNCSKEASLVRHHHEWYNGNGYPSKLSGHAIPFGARIIAVADAYDAMSFDRVYRKALPLQERIRRIKEGKGRQFDPEVVEALERVIVKEAIRS